VVAWIHRVCWLPTGHTAAKFSEYMTPSTKKYSELGMVRTVTTVPIDCAQTGAARMPNTVKETMNFRMA